MADAQTLLFGRGTPPPTATPGQGRGEGPERKLLTILFVDIVSSSALVVGRDPEDADTSLLSILNVLVEAVTRYDGMLSQLLGDGFMAVFGAPDAKEDHTLRACLAAQDIVRATVDSDIPGFRVRVGLDSGDAVAQVVRSGHWADYRTVGECVHVAAKLQQRADPNTAQLSRSALDLVPVGVTANPAGSLTLAPGARPVAAYTLEGARAVRRTATDLLSSATAPMVGREAERRTLFDIAGLAGRGRAQTLVLRGDAGIGKSRLVGELLRSDLVRDWGMLHWPQMPIRRLGDPDDLEAVAQSLSILLTGTLSGDGPQRVAEAAGRRAGALAGDAVRALFGLTALHPIWSGLDPSQRLTLAIDGLVGAILDRAACTGSSEHPLLILVEDAHWTRPVMGRLLDALSAALADTGAPADGPRHTLLLVTMRPPALGSKSKAEGWMPGRAIRRIEMDALSPEQSHRFLDHWLGDDPSLAELKSKVSARSQGVPLYLEEILRTLETAGDITGSPGAYRLVSPEITLRLPRTVHALLAARIDLLANDPRRVLMRAAVVGATFDVGLLRALQAVSDAALSDELSYLEQAGFVARARLLPNLEYVFRHALIREVAYITLTNSDRKLLHGKVVGALRKRRESDLPNRVELMAHHAFMAEEWPIAYAFGRRAGLRAENRSKLEDASDHYRNALQAIERLQPTRRNILRNIDLSIALPRAFLPRGLKDLNGYMDQAREKSVAVGDQTRLALACSMQAAFEWTHGDIAKAQVLGEDGLNAISKRNNPEIRIQLLIRLGGILAEAGSFAASCETLYDAAAEMDDQPPFGRFGLTSVGRVAVNSQLTRCLAELGNEEGVRRSGQAAMDFANGSDHLFSRLYAQAHYGWASLLLDRPDHAAPMLEEALEFSRSTRSQLFNCFVLGAIGYCHVLNHDLNFGIDLLERSRKADSYIGAAVWTNQVEIWLADSWLRKGRSREALVLAKAVFKRAQATSRMGHATRAKLMCAKAAAACGEPLDAIFSWLNDTENSAKDLSMQLVLRECRKLRMQISNSLPESTNAFV